MNEKAKLALELVVKRLDKEARSPERGSWHTLVEKEIKTHDEDTLRETTLKLTLIETSQQGIEDAVGKILVGENIFTPSLTNKGWQFWKQSPLTEVERDAVGSAVIRWSKAKVTQLDSLREDYERLNNKDTRSALICLAKGMDINSCCRQQLSDDLKKILANAVDH